MEMPQSEGEKTARKSDFSIEHILNRAGEKTGGGKVEAFGGCGGGVVMLPWLQCTRYCPPKIPRKREAPQKRQLGRHPRIPFTSHQLAVLEQKFQQSPYLSSEEVTRLSQNLQLADVRVKIWFQNRRARERREKAMMEAGTVKLKNTAGCSSREISGEVTKQTDNNVLLPVTSTVFINSSNSLLITQPRFTLQK